MAQMYMHVCCTIVYLMSGYCEAVKGRGLCG